jgi:DNA-binding transcriptional LysR family regulator
MTGSAEGVARVLRDEADLAILVLPLADSRLDIHPLFEEEVLLAVPPGHRWAAERVVQMADVLSSGELLCSMPGLGLRAQVDEAAAKLGVSLEPRVEMRSQQALLAMVAAGGGMALAPRLAVAHRDDVRVIAVSPPMRRRIGWVRRRGRHLTRPAMELVEAMRDRA